MIDIGIAGKAPSADLSAKAGSGASSGPGEKAGSGGDFLEALADAGHHSRKLAVGERGNQHSSGTKAGEGADGGATVEADSQENGACSPAKPIIEISRRNLHGANAQPPAVDADALNLAAENQREETETQSASSQARIAKRLAKDDAKAASMKNDAGLSAGQIGTIGEAVDSGKTEKAKSSKGRDAAQGAGTDAEDDGTVTDSGLGDVLSLLTGNKADLAQAGLAAGQAASAISVKPDRSEKGHTSSDESLSALKSLTPKVSDTATGPDVPDGAAEPQGDADRAFRFVRADGKGQSLSMRVAASEDKPAHFETGTANEGGQTVAVLDARRYLAPASNAASITAAMVGDSEWAHAMQPGSELTNALTQSNTGKVVNTLKIQMSPIELGNVTATLRLTGDELTVHLTVENRAAFKHLNDDQSDMLKALRSQGLAVDQIQISLSGAADRATSDAGQSGAQGQQASQGGGQNATGGGGRHEPFTQPDRGGIAMGRTGDDAGTVQTVGGDSGTAGGLRPDHVYI